MTKDHEHTAMHHHGAVGQPSLRPQVSVFAESCCASPWVDYQGTKIGKKAQQKYVLMTLVPLPTFLAVVISVAIAAHAVVESLSRADQYAERCVRGTYIAFGRDAVQQSTLPKERKRKGHP